MTFKTSSKKCAEIDAASKEEEHLLAGITHPGLHDCLCGRGGHATNHPGNVQFRMLVNQYKDYYMGLSRYGKLQVAAEVVRLWRAQTPNGRFLAMTDPAKRESTTWHDIGDKEAIKKTSQCLRERIPPNQKARTLKMDEAAEKQSKKKTSALKLRETLLKKNSNNSTTSSSQQSVQSTQAPQVQQQQQSRQPGDWERTQLQLLLDDECQQPTTSMSMPSIQNMSQSQSPRPQMATSNSSNQVQFNIPEPTPVHNMNMSNMNMPRANEQHLQRLMDSYVSTTSGNNNGNVNGMTYTQPLSDGPSSSSMFAPPHKREQSWSGISVGSWNAADELWGIDDEDQVQQEQAITGMTVGGGNYSDQSNGNNVNGQQQQQHNVDSTQVPSAANLTQNVFDDDDCTPSRMFVGRQQQQQQSNNNFNPSNYKSFDTAGMGGFGSQTTLNQTLSSSLGLSQLFSNNKANYAA